MEREGGGGSIRRWAPPGRRGPHPLAPSPCAQGEGEVRRRGNLQAARSGHWPYLPPCAQGEGKSGDAAIFTPRARRWPYGLRLQVGEGDSLADGVGTATVGGMVDHVVTQLKDVDVLTPAGAAVKLGSLFEGRAVLLAMIRHFG